MLKLLIWKRLQRAITATLQPYEKGSFQLSFLSSKPITKRCVTNGLHKGAVCASLSVPLWH